MPRPTLPPISAEVILTLRVPRAHWPALSQAVHAQIGPEPHEDHIVGIVTKEFNPMTACRHLLRPPRPREQAADWLTNYLTHVSHLRPFVTEWRFERR